MHCNTVGLAWMWWLLQGLFDRILPLNSTRSLQYGYIRSPLWDFSDGAMGLVIWRPVKCLLWFPFFFAWLLSATCSQGEERDQRFNAVSWDLNKWSSSKTIFPHLSPAKRFICLVICDRASRLTEAVDEGKGKEWGGAVLLRAHARLVER